MTLTLALLFWISWLLIFYAYALFPVALALVSRAIGTASSAPDLADGDLPHVSMIVAAYNEERVLRGKLANTWDIDYPGDKFEILIGSDGSTDGTAAILAACADPRLKTYPFAERRGKISVLNHLVPQATGEILIMSDANTLFHPDAVRRLVAHFAEPRVGCVSGVLELESEGGVSGEGIYWRYENWIKRSESRLGFLMGCNGGIYALRSSLYPRLPSGTVVEDFVITLRVLQRGFRVVLEPDARASEPATESARAEMVRKIRIGAGNWQALSLSRQLLSPRYGLTAFAFWGHKVLRWCVPVLMAISLAANVLLASSPVYLTLLVLQAMAISMTGWVYTRAPGQRVPILIRPISYFYLMNFALMCGLFRYLRGSQKVTWERASEPGGQIAAHVQPEVTNERV